MTFPRLLSLLGLLAVSSCMDNGTEPVCLDPERSDPLPAGIRVTAFDSVSMTNATIGTKVVARQSATVADSVNSATASPVWVGKATGIYSLTITKAGYQPWTRSNVDVQADACGFIPVLITALLQPQ